jgi:hypothetical protein
MMPSEVDVVHGAHGLANGTSQGKQHYHQTNILAHPSAFSLPGEARRKRTWGEEEPLLRAKTFWNQINRNLFKPKKKQHNSKAAIKNNNRNDNYNNNRIN